jgi:hypothetical protein
VRQLRAAGAGKVFREVASGAKTDRAQLVDRDPEAKGKDSGPTGTEGEAQEAAA